MSEDGSTPSGTGSPQDAPDDGGPSFRLAIVAKTDGAVEALWSALDHRSRSRNRPSQTRATRADADIIVYLPTAEDFSSESAVQSFAADIARDAAEKKIVFEPASLNAQEAIHLRDRLRAECAIEWVAAGEMAEAKPARDEDALRARQIERLLRGAPSRPEVPASLDTETEPQQSGRGNSQHDRSLKREQKTVARREARAQKGEKPGRQRARESAPVRDPVRRTKRQSAELDPAVADVRARRKARPGADLAPRARTRREPDGQHSNLPSVSIALSGLGAEEKTALMESLRRAFEGSGVQPYEAKPSARAHISVHAFDDHPPDRDEVERLSQNILASKARLKILLDRTTSRTGMEAESTEPENPAIAQTSLLCRGSLFDLDALFGRHGIDATEAAQDIARFELTAALIAREAASIPDLALSRKPLSPPPDLADVLRLAEAPSDLLSKLTWSGPNPPKALQAHYAQPDVETFAERRIVLSEEDVRSFSDGIDWQSPVADGRAASRLFGLEFLIAPLSYWYSKASDRRGEQLEKIDAWLKQRGVTASTLLSDAGSIIRDFLEKMPSQVSSAAWQDVLVSARIRALTCYVLCCRLALKRRIRFDEAAFAAGFRGLTDHIELLRSARMYPLIAAEGVERDCLLAGVALALQQTDYGAVLLRESLQRLRRRQLDIGLSADGVWRNASFATHCAVLSEVTTLLGDLAAAGSTAMEPIAEAARRMTLFVDAMLKSNGEPLPIDVARPRSYASTLAAARHILALVGARPSKGRPSRGMAASRITETYVFRDAQYFVSHSTPKVTPESSQVAFHAEAGSSAKGETGGLLLAFAHGPSNLLLGQVSRRKELPGLTNLPTWHPALRNGYDIGGESDAPALQQANARIVKSWRGAGWAAAKGIESYGRAELARTVVHLKALHAVLVVDEFEDMGEIESIEQFWHVAPNLAPPENPGEPLQFTVPGDGFLTLAFDGRPAASLERDSFSSCVRHLVQVGRGVTASLFRWTSLREEADLSLQRRERDDWLVAFPAAGAELRVSLAANDLRVEGLARSEHDPAESPQREQEP
jgi:hypothetical protein